MPESRTATVTPAPVTPGRVPVTRLPPTWVVYAAAWSRPIALICFFEASRHIVRRAGYSSVLRPLHLTVPILLSVEELTHQSCDLCQAVVPRSLASFHRLWHKDQAGRPTRLFGDLDLDPEVARLLRVVAALRAVPPVEARPEFVTFLREQLMAQAPDRGSLSVR